jgi:septum formation protein
MDVLKQKIILASQSPRRRELMERAGFEIDVRPLDIDESFPEDMPVEEVAEYLALKKAKAGRSLLGSDDILLTADSVVILGGKIYEKPVDAADAAHILRQLSGRKHRVITGVCLMKTDQQRTFSGISDVTFSTLTDEEIQYYIQTYQPFDKAGGYGIQDWIGLCKVEKIEGTYSNIMGLPMELVYRELSKMIST